MDNSELWHQILTKIEPEIPRANFITWFNQTTILKFENQILFVGLPLPMYLNWHETRLKKVVLEKALSFLPDIKNVEYTIDLTLKDKANSKGIDILKHFPSKNKKRKLPKKHEVKLSMGVISKILSPKYTLQNFVVGDNNRLAHAACLATASHPGKQYNPLLIYGGVGLGKTHLLQATGNEIIKNLPDKSVAYLTSEDFTNEVIDAIRKRKMDELRKKYRQVDVLIIDDIQFIANKDRTQEEFFHTFNSLYLAGKQVIISSDRPPAELDILEPRLRSRFEMGMIADVFLPVYETRLAILHEKSKEFKIFISNDVFEFVAYNITRSVRELEGVLMQIIAQFELQNITPTIRSVEKILKHINKETTPVGFIEKNEKSNFVSNFDDIIEIVCHHFNVPQSEVIGQSRLREYTVPRQIAMYLGKTKMNIALKTIGGFFSGRDHASVIHAVKKIDKELKNNRQLIRDVNSIKEECGMI